MAGALKDKCGNRGQTPGKPTFLRGRADLQSGASAT